MVGSSKILTVSYGTFSCTLEGFDDSFDTMKAIAEYFRDLAADDRYFGAEPPTPDAEMLARIAEREIARRVEAHEHQGRIVLRAEEAARDTALPVSARSAAAAAAAAPSEAPQPASETVAPPEADTAPLATNTEDPAELADTQPEADIAAAPETEAEPAPEMPEASEWVEDDDAKAAAPQDLAAKLNLIRSVVGIEAQYSEDEHAQDFVAQEASVTQPWPDAVADAPAEVPEDAEPVSAEAIDASSDSDDDAEAMWHWDDQGQDAEAENAAEAEAGIDDVIAEVAEEEATHPAEMPEEDEAAMTLAQGPLAQDDTTVADDETAARDQILEDTLAALLADAQPDTPEAAAPAQPPHAEGARVLRVKRADFEAAQAEGLFEEVTGQEDDLAEDEDEDPVENIFDKDDSPLSAEEEADLQRELAELDAELDDRIADAATEEAAPDAESHQVPASEPPQRNRLDEVAKENDLGRFFEEADAQMASPEISRRRNTIQHLRAALAATRAEKDAGADLTRKPDAGPYRGDLAAVVRPRRPEAIAAPMRSARPEEPRPAPLKLVAEQRVDTDRAPVRPRRIITPQPDVLEAETGGFCDFAQELGATALPDLLEAAAAYLADVEGRAQFSRPMLMGKLREVDEEGFSREEGLRSFGKLLREGKLQKLSGGRFAVTDATEFRAEARKRAG
jgi:hypothetical protein